MTKSLITSQIDTAPKPLEQNPHCEKTFELTGIALQYSKKCRSTTVFLSCS